MDEVGEILAATKVRVAVKKSEQEHMRHFLHKTCDQEVSRCSRAKQRQRNVQKSVLHVQSCFSANSPF